MANNLDEKTPLMDQAKLGKIEDSENRTESSGSKNQTELIQYVEHSETNSINEIVNRIGFGKYQILLGLGLWIIAFADGAEITLLTIVSFILESEWNLSKFEVSFLGASVLFGMSLGYLTSSLLETKLGRIRVIYLSLVLIVSLGVSSALVNDIWFLSAIRAMVGFATTMPVPASFTLAAEMCPSHVRGRYIMILELAFASGQVYIILLSLLLVPDLNSENWRVLVICSALTIVPSAMMLYFYGNESPLFLARNRKYEQSVAVLNNIAQKNDKEELNEEEIDKVYTMMPSHVKNAGSKVSLMVDKWHIALTVKTISLCTICTVAYYGIIVILPFILDFENAEAIDILYGLLVVYFSQIPCVILLVFIVEKALFGRKNSIIFLSVGISVVMELTAAINEDSITFPMLLLTVSLGNGAFCLLFLYIPEVFETELRVLSFSIANISARFLGSMSIYFFFFLVDQSNVITFAVIGIFFFILSIIAVSLPFDTTGKTLDFQHQ